uniref:Dachshund homolog 1-like n=1 Tax=Tanacetum cinerariifolium TaxID=118510 RepID=A0A699HXT3_TANCI|nr:dachshund homolog 1-like [Tanacetum cinerariifolium]
MARLIGLDSGEGVGILNFEGPSIVFMLCMIVVSMCVLSMIIFACGDSSNRESPKYYPPSVATSAATNAAVTDAATGAVVHAHHAHHAHDTGHTGHHSHTSGFSGGF